MLLLAEPRRIRRIPSLGHSLRRLLTYLSRLTNGRIPSGTYILSMIDGMNMASIFVTAQ